MSLEYGRIFREAWIDGVAKHYPGEPEPSYIAPWEDTPEWERESAAAVYRQVAEFIDTTSGNTSKLTREQKAVSLLCAGLGRYTSTFWIRNRHMLLTGMNCQNGRKKPT